MVENKREKGKQDQRREDMNVGRSLFQKGRVEVKMEGYKVRGISLVVGVYLLFIHFSV